eukprot:12564218-Alexandrium_andersonii.AAC.1
MFGKGQFPDLQTSAAQAKGSTKKEKQLAATVPPQLRNLLSNMVEHTRAKPPPRAEACQAEG